MSGDLTVSRSSYKRTGKLLLIAAACILLVVVADFWPRMTILDMMELHTVDWRFHLRGDLEPHPDIVMVTVDEQSIGRIGKWPWPRRVFGHLTRRLADAGARAIVFDIFFVERQPASGSDEAFVEAVRAAGNVYLAGFTGRLEQVGSRQSGAADRTKSLQRYAWDDVEVVTGRGLLRWARVFELRDLTYPFAELADATRQVGYTCLVRSSDGIFRCAPSVGRFQGRLYPSIPLVVAADLVGAEPGEVTLQLGRHIALGSAHRVPLDRWGRTVINFIGEQGSYPHLPAWQILQSDQQATDLTDKIVVVAVTVEGLHDLRATPFGGLLPGGEVQATILDNILTQRFLIEAPPEKMLLVLAFIGLVVGLCFAILPTAQALPLSLAVIIAYDWFAVWLFTRGGLIVDMLTPSLAGLLAVLALVTYRLLREERQRDQARETLSHFVPSQIVSQLVEDEAAETLAGQRRVVSCLFCDLRGFTAASEQLSPEATVSLLDRYFTLMHEVIWEFEGTLDKLMGDGLMAFFNAPLAQPDHAWRAVRSAIEMQRRIEFNRAEWEFYGWGELAAGIGIATGEAVVGYITAHQRMQYTAIGAQVNLAARLEELTRELDEKILISPATYELVKDSFPTAPQGQITVRGFADKVSVYAVRVSLE